MYDYILLRSDEKYSEFIEFEIINKILTKFDNCTANEYGCWSLKIEEKILRIEAINCNIDGNYNFDTKLRITWKKFNLIEINIPEMIDKNHELKISKIVFQIAEKINWEIYDHETDSIIRKKIRPTTGSS